MNGIFQAIVENNVDPTGMGRVQVRLFEPPKIPTEQLPWAEYCSPFGGYISQDGSGFWFIPEVGDVVYIMFEGGDPVRPVYIGHSFRQRTSTVYPPQEGVTKLQEPRNRVIKTKAGHTIELDDREADDSNTPSTGIRITSAGQRGLWLSDAQESVKLFNAQPNGNYLLLEKKGIKLMSALNNGLKVYDPMNSVYLQSGRGKVNITMLDQAITITAPATILNTANNYEINAKNSIALGTGGNIKIKAGDIRFSVTGDIAGAVNNFNILPIGSANFTLTGGPTGGNFNVDITLPSPTGGLTGTSGCIDLNTTVGQAMMRVGKRTPNPSGTPLPYIPSVIDLGDLTRLGRIGISSKGNVAVEGLVGGIYISGIPKPSPGSVTPLGFKTFAGPGVAPLTGLPTGSSQAAVMGNNLVLFLQEFMTALTTWLTANMAGAPVYTITGVGPGVLNPAVITAWAALQASVAKLTTQITAPSNPMGVLSNIVFIDG